MWITNSLSLVDHFFDITWITYSLTIARSCPLPLAPLATSAISGFAPLTAFAKLLRQEKASFFYGLGASQTRRTLCEIPEISGLWRKNKTYEREK
jgi:hypothetical protein